MKKDKNNGDVILLTEWEIHRGSVKPAGMLITVSLEKKRELIQAGIARDPQRKIRKKTKKQTDKKIDNGNNINS